MAFPKKGSVAYKRMMAKRAETRKLNLEEKARKAEPESIQFDTSGLTEVVAAAISPSDESRDPLSELHSLAHAKTALIQIRAGLVDLETFVDTQMRRALARHARS